MSGTAPRGNPAVVGLAGFGITTMLLQFHNVGWCGVGPIVSMAFIFGGKGKRVAGSFNGTTPPVLHITYEVN